MKIVQRFYFFILEYKDFKMVNKCLRELNHNIGLTSMELRKIQVSKLSKLFTHAKTHTSYWKEVLGHIELDVIKNDPKNLLEKLPVLSKAIIRMNEERMWSNGVEDFIIATTGGTTGYPLTIRRDNHCVSLTKAALYRAKQNWGVEPWDKVVYLHSFGKGTILGHIRMFLSNKRIGEAFPSSQVYIDKNDGLITKFRPKAIEGFATGLLSLTNQSKKKERPQIPVIISTGEMLYDHQRKMLESYYEGEVYTYYGSNEIGSIAFECKNHNLHITEDHVIVETVDDQGRVVINQPGKVLVTDLDNFAMPFFRYELGDMAILSDKPCGCGNNSKIIKRLLGRTQEYLLGLSGERLQATQLAGFLKDLTSTGQIQFIQRRDGVISILHDAQGEKTSIEMDQIVTHLRKRLGNVQVVVKYVEEIEKTTRGKQPLVLRPQ